MIREAQRTLTSLTPPFQTDVSEQDYEIIAIDSGSEAALDPDALRNISPVIRYHFFDTNSVSPAAAVNFGAELAQGEQVAIIVDGARMASPGLIHKTLTALSRPASSFVFSLAWHLGPDVQNISMSNGYDQTVEDELLEALNWREDGYRLFDVSTIAQSSAIALESGMPSECSYFAMSKSKFFEIGGFDEQFQSPGGGLVNHDFLERVLKQEDLELLLIRSEGVFHQFHGGVATNVPLDMHPMPHFKQEYLEINGRPYSLPMPKSPSYIGTLHPSVVNSASYKTRC